MSQSTPHPQWLEGFVQLYQKLDKSNLSLLEQVYHPQVIFEDPIHRVEGLSAVEHYFANLYENLSYCRFSIEKVIVDNDQAAVYWLMSFSHRKLNGGQTVNVKGNTLLQCLDDKVIYHRDYFDVGAMLYEHVPLLGRAVCYVKNRLVV